MKRRFLLELELELRNNNVDEEKIKSIVTDYEKTFDIGYDAGLDYEAIIRKVGTPKSIASEYSGKKVNEKVIYSEEGITFNPSELYNIRLDLVYGDVEIKHHNSDEILVLPDEDNYKYIDITFKDNVFSIKSTKRYKIFFNDKRKGNFIIYLPRDINVDKIKINDVISKFKIDYLSADKIKLNTVNGKLNINSITSNDLKIETVNGDVNIISINSSKCDLGGVNGSYTVNMIEAKRCDISTVSGNINIKNVDESILKVSKLAGRVKINQ